MREPIRIIQINVNCSWGAFDLLKQHMVESKIGLALISEPPVRLKNSSTYYLAGINSQLSYGDQNALTGGIAVY